MRKYISIYFILLTLCLAAQSTSSEQWNCKKIEVGKEPDRYRRAVMPTKAFEEARIKSIDKYFTTKTIRGQFNGVVLFADKDKIFSKAYGYSNYKTRTKHSTSSIFQLASISKTITATAILMLAQDGKIDINSPVSTYLEDFGHNKITVAMLLSHTSGVADYIRFTAGAKAGTTEFMSNEQMLDIMVHRRPAALFAPGVMYKYSNTNYALLASIVERVAKESFSSWVHKNIFTPIGMEDTFFCIEERLSTEKNVSTGYTSRKYPYSLNYLDGVLGDKGVYSTALDLLKFDLAMRSGFLLEPKWLALAYTDHTPDGNTYGYGWRTSDYMDHQIVYHNGWWHGFKGRFLRLPQEDRTIIVLENQAKGTFSVPTLINISDKLFEKYVSDTTIVETGEEISEE